MSNSYELDQAMAINEAGLDHLVTKWRESLERKHARHGQDFHEIKAMTDLVSRLVSNDMEAILTVAVTAVNRLAKMEDYNSVPAEIAELDFDFEVEEEDES
jgi:hypothetical protein